MGRSPLVLSDMPRKGDTVYFKANSSPLPVHDAIGKECSAIVTDINPNGTLNLYVFPPDGPAFRANGVPGMSMMGNAPARWYWPPHLRT